jgi:uncharacterized membrane protein YqjE
MDRTTVLWLVVILSEILAALLIWRIWHRDDYRIMKIVASFVALIPVVGTLGVLWAYGFPPVKPRALQNRNRIIPTTEVFDRWRHVLDEKDEKKRQHAASELLKEHRND